MHSIEKQVKDNKGNLITTIGVQQADNYEDMVAIAGSAEAANAVFNRQWVVMEQNRNRPGRGGGTGAKEVMAAVKHLSPEVQALLKNKSAEEIADLLQRATESMQ